MKIFCIGLSRTGTKSLSVALNMLGYDAKHWDYTAKTLITKHNRLSLDIDKYVGPDAFLDTPVAHFYKDLDRAFPGSKFILTVRDLPGWLRSVEKHFMMYNTGKLMIQSKRVFKTFKLHRELYGTVKFDRKKFIAAYLRHVKGVKEYFKERPEDLLELDICAGDGWAEVCAFLGKEDPGLLFPSTNSNRGYGDVALKVGKSSAFAKIMSIFR